MSNKESESHREDAKNARASKKSRPHSLRGLRVCALPAKPLPWLAPAFVIALAALACNAPEASPRIPVSTEAAGQLIENLQNLTPGPAGTITITMTQEQLTSLVALELAKHPDAPVEDVQIALDDGQAQFSGNMNTPAGIAAPVKATLSISVNAAGRPEVKVESASFGGLPLPPPVLDAISAAVADALAKEIETSSGKITLTSILIDDGSMTVTGQPAQ